MCVSVSPPSSFSPFLVFYRWRCFSFPILFTRPLLFFRSTSMCFSHIIFHLASASLVHACTESQKLPHLICSDIVLVRLSFFIRCVSISLSSVPPISALIFFYQTFFHLILLGKINPFSRFCLFSFISAACSASSASAAACSFSSNERFTSNTSHNVKRKQKNRLTFLNKHWDLLSSIAIPSIVNPACINIRDVGGRG